MAYRAGTKNTLFQSQQYGVFTYLSYDKKTSICYTDSSTKVAYWTRSGNTETPTSNAYVVTNGGYVQCVASSDSYGIRPACVFKIT